MSKLKIALIVVILVVVIGSIVGYKMYNKPHAKVEDVAGIEVSAEELSNEYNKDEAIANSKYLDEAIAVTGTITGTETNQDGKLLVILDDDVQCTMRDKAAEVSTGNTITMKGFCSGTNLFGVVLRDCVILK